MRKSSAVVYEKANHVHIFHKRAEILPHEEVDDLARPLQIWYLRDGGVYFACGYDADDDAWDVWGFSVFGRGERDVPNRIPRWLFDAIPDEAFANLRGKETI